MEVVTNSARVLEHRRAVLRLMLAEHPESCLVCGKGNRCRLRQTAAELGIGDTGLYRMPGYRPLEDSNPFIVRDLSKCVLCGKCIRADQELVVTGAIDYSLRGFSSRPATAHNVPLEGSTCTFCGTCVSMCPTGALMVKSLRHVGTPEKEIVSVCGFCGVGCSLSMGSSGGSIVEVNPSGRADTVNGATACVRGHFAYDFLGSTDRLTEPMLKRDGQMVPVSWDEAFKTISERLLGIKKLYGPQSIAFIGSSKCSNEENYLFQKIARVFLDTNNIDSGAYCGGRASVSYAGRLAGGLDRIRPIKNLEDAEAIMLLGADPSQSAPVVSYAIKRAARKGIPVLSINPIRTEMVPFSSLWMRPRPGTDYHVLNAISKFLDGKRSQNNYEACLENPEIENSSFEAAANIISGRKITFVVGRGVLQSKNALICMEALLSLARVTGSLGNANAGILFLTEENNESGSWDMGAVPDMLPGRGDISDPSTRKQWERIWGKRISPDRGLNLVRMIEEAERGSIKGMYVMGENPLRSLPDRKRVAAALGKLEFLVVQDILNTETAMWAHLIIPGAAFAEKEGSFTSMEGRIQGFSPVVPAPGKAIPDWKILDTLSSHLGSGETYGSIARIRSEISINIPSYEKFPSSGESCWLNIEEKKGPEQYANAGEVISTDSRKDNGGVSFPYTAVLASSRFQMGCGTRTSRSARIKAMKLDGIVEISEHDMAELGLRDGDSVRIASRTGSIIRSAKISKNVSKGVVCIFLAFDRNDAMDLLELTDLESRRTPGWRSCGVSLERI